MENDRGIKRRLPLERTVSAEMKNITVLSNLPQKVERTVSSRFNQKKGMVFLIEGLNTRFFEGDEWVDERPGQMKIDVVATPTMGAKLSGVTVINAEVTSRRGREVHAESRKLSHRLILKKYVIQSLAPYQKVQGGIGFPDPSGITAQPILETSVHISNKDGDHSAQEGQYSGEYICAAQYRQLDLKLEWGSEVMVPSSIDLLPLADWGNGICADEESETSTGEVDETETPKSFVVSVPDESSRDSDQAYFELAELAEVEDENQTSTLVPP